MRRTTFYATLVICSLATTFLQAQMSEAEAGRSFKTGCLHCHQPPDLTFASDRAWLDQLLRTR